MGYLLGEEFAESGVSTILDVTMGYGFHWQHVDAVRGQYAETFRKEWKDGGCDD